MYSPSSRPIFSNSNFMNFVTVWRASKRGRSLGQMCRMKLPRARARISLQPSPSASSVGCPVVRYFIDSNTSLHHESIPNCFVRSFQKQPA
jgi:hypothetical protein